MIITRFMAIALICCTVIPNVYAGVGVERGLFSKGRLSSTLYASNARAGNKDYVVAGLGIGYYIVDGLQIGVDGEDWLGNSPHHCCPN